MREGTITYDRGSIDARANKLYALGLTHKKRLNNHQAVMYLLEASEFFGKLAHSCSRPMERFYYLDLQRECLRDAIVPAIFLSDLDSATSPFDIGYKRRVMDGIYDVTQEMNNPMPTPQPTQ